VTWVTSAPAGANRAPGWREPRARLARRHCRRKPRVRLPQGISGETAMSQYTLRSIQLSDFGRHQMLTIMAGFVDNAQPPARQRAVDNLIKLHGIDLKTTSSLRYDPTLTTRDGKNVNGDIRIGPGAFSQDSHWLANVVFHEVVHSDQFAYYADHGVQFGNRATKSEAERIMVALDECEGFYWPWRNSGALGLSADQQASLRREVGLWLIEIDDAPTVALARKGDFEQARLALIKRWTAENKSNP